MNSKENVWDRINLKPKAALIVICLLLLAVIALSTFIIRQSSQDAVLVKVNGESITKDDLFSEMYVQVGQEILENMIKLKLLSHQAELKGINVSDDEVEANIKSIINESFDGSEQEFAEALSFYGYTMDSFRKEIEAEILLEKMVFVAGDITEEDLRQYYEDYIYYFGQSEEIEVRHILLETEAEAEMILNLLEQGSDFADLAMEYSKDESSSVEGGYLGFIMRGMMVEEFEEIAFNLAIGEIGGPVTSEFGVHLIEVLSRVDGEAVPFEEVKFEVYEYLKEDLINEYVMLLFEEADINYIENDLIDMFQGSS